MPALGDTPNTSYFSKAVSSSSKRKNKSSGSEVPTSNKRRKSSPLPLSSSSTEAAPRGYGKEKESKQPVQEKSRAKSLTDDDDSSPHTPMTRLTRRIAAAAVPPTPPTTGTAVSKRLTRSQKERRVTPETPAPSTSSITGVLPTPVTAPRRSRQSRLHVEAGVEEDDTDAGPPPSSSNATAEQGDVDTGVPSSQSQYVSGARDAQQPKGLGANTSPVMTPNSRRIGVREAKTVEDIVESSQSQPSFGLPPSPRKRRLQIRMPDPMESMEIIPSSQSQENELVMPTGPFDIDSEWSRKKSPKSLSTAKLPSQPQHPPQRTLSDELFPIPVQDSLLAGIFSDEEGENDAYIDHDASLPMTQASATESETEDETQDAPVRPPVPQSDEPRSPELHNTQLSAMQDSQGSYADASYSSLPLAVQEFRDMFGNGDESYPVDFPESLRS